MRWALGAVGVAVCLFISGCSGSNGGSGGSSPNPVPSVSSISPANATAGSAALNLTIAGTNFVSGSQAQWNGTPLITTYQSATSLTVQVPAADLSTAGTVNITVVNSAPGGGTSGLAFTVNDPVPVLSSISPTGATNASPTVTLTATGSNFVNGSQVLYNGAALTTTYVSPTQLTALIPAENPLAFYTSSTTASITVSNPSPGGGASNALSFAITALGTTVTSLSLPINHLVWDATHASLYASLGGTATNANTIVAINPVTAAITSTQTSGNDPDVLALSQDNSFLYAGIDGTGQIIRYNVPSLTPDTSLNIQLPNDRNFGQDVSIGLAVAPGAPHTVATILGSIAWGAGNTGGTVIYDDATPRPTNIAYNDEGENSLAWGANASVLYGNNSSSTGYDLYVNSVNSSGLSLTHDYGYLIPEQYSRIYFDPSSAHIYSDGGRVVDPATDNIVGTFDLPFLSNFPAWRCVPDLANGKVFFLGQTTSQLSAAMGVTLETFDAKTYQLLSTLTLPTVAGSAIIDFLRWGNAGLAFTMGGQYGYFNPQANTLYLLDGSFVSATATPDFTNGTVSPPLATLSSMSPQSTTAGTAALTITVNGANFNLLSKVEWNGYALSTTYVSGSQLQAAVLPSFLASAGSAVVTVGPTPYTAPNSLTFTVTPASGSTQITAENLAALDIAWDAKDSHLIVPVWSTDPQYADSILAIDPSTGNVVQSTAVYTDPDLVRVTSDDSLVYTAYSKDNWVTQLSLPNLTAPTSFSLGADQYEGPYFAIDLQPAPGADATTAVALGVEGDNPDESGIVIFDNGTPRPTKAPGFGQLNGNQYDYLQWGANDSTLYASDKDTNLQNFYTFAVGSSGISLSQKSNAIGASPIHFDATSGYVYDDAGQVLNPDTLTVVGNYNASGVLAVDSTLNRVFILGQTTAQNGTANYTLQSFNQTQYTPVSSITLSSVVGTPVAITRWGNNGLAFVTYNATASATGGPAGMLYILEDTTFVSANARSTGISAKDERVHAVPHAWPFSHAAEK